MEASTTTETDIPGFKVEPVNVDSLKAILHAFATAHPFADETQQSQFHTVIDKLDKAGDPTVEDEVAETDEVAKLQAKIAELEAAQGSQVPTT